MTNTYKLLFAAALALAPAVVLAGTPCTRDGSGAITVTAQCATTPQAYDVTIYKLGLCTANPALAANPDFSSCAMLIDGAGQLAHLVAGSSVVLSASSVPRHGTYGFAVMVASNSIGITSTQRYDTAQTGAAGGPGGTTCWSVAGTVDRENPPPSLVACGSTPTPGVTIDKLSHFSNGGAHDPSAGGTFNGLSSTVAVVGGSMNAKLATSSLATAVAADWPSAITRLIAVQTFSAGVRTDAATRGLDVAFDVSNSSTPWIDNGTGALRQYGTGPFSMVITTR